MSRTSSAILIEALYEVNDDDTAFNIGEICEAKNPKLGQPYVKNTRLLQ